MCTPSMIMLTSSSKTERDVVDEELDEQLKSEERYCCAFLIEGIHGV